MVLPPPTAETGPVWEPSADLDGDGFKPSEGDCDDGDSDVNPGAAEVCDDVDNDCDVEVDEGCDDTAETGDGA